MKSLCVPSIFAATLLTAMSIVITAPARAQSAIVATVSNAETAKAYKMDAARHVYKSYPDRIYKGKLPALVHAIVVLEVSVDAHGNVLGITTIRVPTHAPEVTLAVKDMIERSSPLPAPARIGAIKFTEVWLVDKSGRFQLDTLTEGQH